MQGQVKECPWPDPPACQRDEETGYSEADEQLTAFVIRIVRRWCFTLCSEPGEAGAEPECGEKHAGTTDDEDQERGTDENECEFEGEAKSVTGGDYRYGLQHTAYVSGLWHEAGTGRPLACNRAVRSL